MDQMSEAEVRALDARCRLPTSPAARTAVVRLRALPPASQAQCIVNYAKCDLPHLVCCALVAGLSADTRWGETDAPVLSFAAALGSVTSAEGATGRPREPLADGQVWKDGCPRSCAQRPRRLPAPADRDRARSNRSSQTRASRRFTTPLRRATLSAARCCSQWAATPTLA